jgi:hydrophobe/amphiphile efflux-3 (HAE3) family protein
MIRDFGVMLAIGAAALFVAALVVVPSVLAWRDARRPRFGVTGRRVRIERAVGWLAGLARGKAAVTVVLILVVTVGGFGIYAQQHTTIQSDPERFVAQDSPVLRDLRRVREVAQSSGDFGVMIEADDIMRPEVLAWMHRFETQEMRAHRKTLFRSSSIASIVATVTNSEPTPQDVEPILSVAPPAISRTFLSADHKRAHMIFAIGPVSLQEYKGLITSMRADMRGALRPPSGVHVVMSGLTVVGIEAVDALSANRWQMAGVALIAVLFWLLIAFWRRPLRAVLALVPVLAALGLAWSVVFLLGVEVNSLTALSSPLVIAVGTEFSVLVMERYLEERRRGTPPDEAINTAALRIGRAFTASGLATAAGFGVLAFSGFPLLSNFGTVVALNVLVVLLSSLVLFPPLLRTADRWLIDKPTATRAAALRTALEPTRPVANPASHQPH